MITKQQSLFLKGVLTLVVLLHHLLLNAGFVSIFDGGYRPFRLAVGHLVAVMGFFSVAGFFFLSGYGLRVSYDMKGIKYVREMPYKRIFPLYVIIGISAVIYYFFYGITTELPTLRELVKTLGFGSTVIYYGWFLQAIMLLYILFFMVFFLLERSRCMIMIKAIIIMLLYFSVCAMLRVSSVYYISTPLFAVGLVWRDIYQHCTNRRWLLLGLLVCSWIGWVIFYVGESRLERPMFAIFLILAMGFMLSFINKMSDCSYMYIVKTGKMCLELYIFQGLFFRLFHNKRCAIDKPLVYSVVTISMIFLFAMAMNKIFKYILRR